jgi:hypothetical protein
VILECSEKMGLGVGNVRVSWKLRLGGLWFQTSLGKIICVDLNFQLHQEVQNRRMEFQAELSKKGDLRNNQSKKGFVNFDSIYRQPV